MEMALTVTVTVTGTVTVAICCKLCFLFQCFCLLLSYRRPPFLSWLCTMPVKGSWQMCSPALSVLLAGAAIVSLLSSVTGHWSSVTGHSSLGRG